MATFVATNSGGVKKTPMIILKECFFFVLVSTSWVSDWQVCKDSHWNNRTTFVFHKIVIYNPWTWKQSEDSLKISLTAKRSEFTDVQKLFLLRREIEDNIDHYVSCRVFFLLIKRESLMFSLRKYCLDFLIFTMIDSKFHFSPTFTSNLFFWTRNKNDRRLKHDIIHLVKCTSMIISIVMPSYPNVTLFLCHISERWPTACTLDTTINHKIL